MFEHRYPMGSFDPARDRYLNINAFSQPPLFTIGNAPPRMPHVRTPNFLNEDFSVFKNIAAYRSLDLAASRRSVQRHESRRLWWSCVKHQQSGNFRHHRQSSEYAAIDSARSEVHFLMRMRNLAKVKWS